MSNDAPYLVLFAALVAIALVYVGRPLLHHRRFGMTRLLPDREYVRLGETFAGVLEAGPRLAYAPEVRFELVMFKEGEHVRATATVPVGGYEAAGDRTRVRVALPVPADAWPNSRRTSLALALIAFPIGFRVTQVKWEVRVSALVGGPPFRMTFPVNVEPASAREPRAYRAIVLPPPDTRVAADRPR